MSSLSSAAETWGAEQRPRHGFETSDPRLHAIAARVEAGERLGFDDGVALYRSDDILAVGWMANAVRERMHGDIAYFNVNRHINPTNVCVASCRLCAFGRKKGAAGTYTMALEEAWATAGTGLTEAVTEFHIVGGLDPDLPFEYFEELVRGLKERYPKVHVKAFTMVEVAFFAKLYKMTIEETLRRLKTAGVDSLPGGGAEIFADRVRHIICDHKIDGGEWLETARAAHKIGLRSNATMLYGHVENDEDREDHMLRLRELLDDIYSAGVPSRQHRAGAHCEDDGDDGPQTDCGGTAAAGQLRAREELLADGVAGDGADLAAVWGGRHRRDGDRGEDLPRRGRDHSAGNAAGGFSAADYRGRACALRARHAVSRGDAQRGHVYGCGLKHGTQVGRVWEWVIPDIPQLLLASLSLAVSNNCGNSVKSVCRFYKPLVPSAYALFLPVKPCSFKINS
jgi:biotin synthase-like enzyme